MSPPELVMTSRGPVEHEPFGKGPAAVVRAVARFLDKAAPSTPPSS